MLRSEQVLFTGLGAPPELVREEIGPAGGAGRVKRRRGERLSCTADVSCPGATVQG